MCIHMACGVQNMAGFIALSKGDLHSCKICLAQGAPILQQ